MIFKRMQVSLLVLLTLLILVFIPTPSNFFMKAKSAEHISQEILRRNREMELAFNANDMMGVAAFYSDSCVLIGENVLIKGREEVDSYWKSLKDKGISWDLKNVQIDVCDGLAVQQGISKLVYIFQGQEQVSVVRFTLVWKRINEEWFIEVDHYSRIQ